MSVELPLIVVTATARLLVLQLLVVSGVRVLCLFLIKVLIVEIESVSAALELGLLQSVLLLLVLLESACHCRRVCMQLFQLLLICKVVVLIGVSCGIFHYLHLLLCLALLFEFHALRRRQPLVLWVARYLSLLLLLLLLCFEQHWHVLFVHDCFTPLNLVLVQEFPRLVSDELHLEDLANRWPFQRIFFK